YLHPALEPALRENCGVVLYDDDALAVVEALAGCSAAEADRIRRALADDAQAEAATAEFMALCSRNQIPPGVAEPACRRRGRGRKATFNRAHALSFASIGIQEAWLKAHSPLAFWAACLAHHQGRYPKRTHVEEAKRCGVAVYGPCVNRSGVGWALELGGGGV